MATFEESLAEANRIIEDQRAYVDALKLEEVVDDALHDYRYSNSETNRIALLKALHAGQVVQMSRVDLPGPRDDLRRFSGRGEHQELCSAVAVWLESIGRAWTADHRRLECPDGIADLRTLDGRLTVEVGHTSAQKILACLDAGLEVLMVPYITAGRFGVLLTPQEGHEHLLDEDRRIAGELAEERGRALAGQDTETVPCPHCGGTGRIKKP